MNAVEEIQEAMLGWRDIAQRRPGWQARFRPTPEGLRAAVVFYALAVVLNVAMQMLLARQFTVPQVIVNLLLNFAPLAGLLIGVWGSLVALRRLPALLDVLVPATWALGFLLIVGLPLTLLPLPTGPLLLLALAYLYYLLVRTACGFSAGLAIAFAAVCLVLLVAVPSSLYMLVANLFGLS